MMNVASQRNLGCFDTYEITVVKNIPDKPHQGHHSSRNFMIFMQMHAEVLCNVQFLLLFLNNAQILH